MIYYHPLSYLWCSPNHLCYEARDQVASFSKKTLPWELGTVVSSFLWLLSWCITLGWSDMQSNSVLSIKDWFISISSLLFIPLFHFPLCLFMLKKDPHTVLHLVIQAVGSCFLYMIVKTNCRIFYTLHSWCWLFNIQRYGESQ